MSTHRPATRRHPPAHTQSPPVVPGSDAGHPGLPAQPAGLDPGSGWRLVGVERLAPSAAQVDRLRRVARGDEDADLVVRGGLVVVVHDGSVVSRDILIVGRYIAAVAMPGALGGRRSLDAAGRYVLPAYVDAGLRIEDTLLSPGELARLVVPHGTGTLLADSTALTALGGTRALDFATGSTTPLRILARSRDDIPGDLAHGVGPTAGRVDTQASAARLPAPVLDRGATPSAAGAHGISALVPGPGADLRQALAGSARAGIRTVAELAAHGHIDHDVHLAVRAGVSPIEAVRRATILPARAYGLEPVLGSIAPARLADLQVVTSLADGAPPDVVVAGGRIAAERGCPLFDNADAPPSWTDGRIRLPADLHAGSFTCPELGRDAGGDGSVLVASIDIPLSAATLGGLPSVGPNLVPPAPGVSPTPGVPSAPTSGMPAGLPPAVPPVVPPVVPPGLPPTAPSAGSAAPGPAGAWSGSGSGSVAGPLAVRDQVRTVRVVPTVQAGQAIADPTRDLQKVAVFTDRGGPGAGGDHPPEIGLLRGCGLSRGALGFTTGQAPGQMIVIGVRDDDMLTAARAIEGMGGGFVVVDQGWVRAACPLPLLGLMSDAPWEAVLGELVAVDTAAAAIGCRLPSPLRTLAALGLLLHTRP